MAVAAASAEACPRCGASLQGAPIPDKDRKARGGETHRSLKIGHYVGRRVKSWVCPFCGGEWPR